MLCQGMGGESAIADTPLGRDCGHQLPAPHPPARATHLGHPEQTAKQYPVCPSWAEIPFPNTYNPKQSLFLTGGRRKEALFSHTFSPEAPGPLVLFCHHPRGWLRTPPARQGQDQSIYIQRLGCRREGSTLDLTLPLLRIGDRSAMNHTANSSPQPLPTGVWRTAFCCQFQLSQSQEWLSLVTLRSCCQALQGVVLALPWGSPHVPVSQSGVVHLLCPQPSSVQR